MHRRLFLKSAIAAGSVLTTAGLARSVGATGPIKIGMLIDTSGPLEVFGQNKLRCLQVGIDEINEAGGLLGRKIELVHRDTQSNNQLYAQFARELVLNEKVDVVFGATTSSAREIARPVLNRANVPYFYNTNYEGGVCQKATFCTSTTPVQMVQPLLPGLIERYGKKVYVLAADYNYGHISDDWAKQIAKKAGGEVIGSEFFPLDASDFSATINRIQSARPDIIHTVFVGPAHGAFWGQWASAGMVGQIPVSSQTFGLTGEQLRMPAKVSEGITVCLNYFEEIDTPENARFLKRFRAKFGDKYGYIGETSMAEYQGVTLWAEAVRKAGATDVDALNKAIKAGISTTLPSGKVSIDPKTNHCVLNMYIAQMKGGKFNLLRKVDAVAPSDSEGQCELIANPATNKQFEPKL
jgi:urea ABC transporter substrate-binding protein